MKMLSESDLFESLFAVAYGWTPPANQDQGQELSKKSKRLQMFMVIAMSSHGVQLLSTIMAQLWPDSPLLARSTHGLHILDDFVPGLSTRMLHTNFVLSGMLLYSHWRVCQSSCKMRQHNGLPTTYDLVNECYQAMRHTRFSHYFFYVLLTFDFVTLLVWGVGLHVMDVCRFASHDYQLQNAIFDVIIWIIKTVNNPALLLSVTFQPCVLYVIRRKLLKQMKSIIDATRQTCHILDNYPRVNTCRLHRRLIHIYGQYGRFFTFVGCLNHFASILLFNVTVCYMVLSLEGFVIMTSQPEGGDGGRSLLLGLNILFYGCLAPLASLCLISSLQRKLRRNLTASIRAVVRSLQYRLTDDRSPSYHIILKFNKLTEYLDMTVTSQKFGFTCALVGFTVTFNYIANVSLSSY